VRTFSGHTDFKMVLRYRNTSARVQKKFTESNAKAIGATLGARISRQRMSARRRRGYGEPVRPVRRIAGVAMSEPSRPPVITKKGLLCSGSCIREDIAQPLSSLMILEKSITASDCE
jgi:hypothetical protein